MLADAQRHRQSSLESLTSKFDFVQFKRKREFQDFADLPDWDERDQPNALSHRRGLAPYVFIPDEEVATHILNQADISKMDFYLPG